MHLGTANNFTNCELTLNPLCIARGKLSLHLFCITHVLSPGPLHYQWTGDHSLLVADRFMDRT